MPSYFEYLPIIPYTNLEDDVNANKRVYLTNLLTRSAFLREVISNSALFYEYEVKEDETPEIIAHKLYGSVNRFWIVLMFNNLMNPYYDFPLNNEQLNDYIEDKYGYDLATAQSTLHHYERETTHVVRVNGVITNQSTDKVIISEYEQDPDTGLATLNPYLPSLVDQSNPYAVTTDTIDETTDVVTQFSINSVSVYTYEFEKNEERRSIKLLDAAYVNRVESEMKRLMSNA